MEPEPASESVDDPHDVVNRSTASPSSQANALAAAALAVARTLSLTAALRNSSSSTTVVVLSTGKFSASSLALFCAQAIPVFHANLNLPVK